MITYPKTDFMIGYSLRDKQKQNVITFEFNFSPRFLLFEVIDWAFVVHMSHYKKFTFTYIFHLFFYHVEHLKFIS